MKPRFWIPPVSAAVLYCSLRPPEVASDYCPTPPCTFQYIPAQPPEEHSHNETEKSPFTLVLTGELSSTTIAQASATLYSPVPAQAKIRKLIL